MCSISDSIVVTGIRDAKDFFSMSNLLSRDVSDDPLSSDVNSFKIDDNCQSLEEFLSTFFGSYELIYDTGYCRIFKIEKPQNHEMPIVLKVRTMSVDEINHYMESLQFHKILFTSDTEDFRRMTLPIYETYNILLPDKEHVIVITEFLYVEKTLAAYILDKEYLSNAGLLRSHTKQLINYIDKIHSQLIGRNFISDIKPENIFVKDVQILMNDLEYCGGTLAYIDPHLLSFSSNDISLRTFEGSPDEIKKSIIKNDLFAVKMLIISMYSGEIYNRFLTQMTTPELYLFLQKRKSFQEPVRSSEAILAGRLEELFRDSPAVRQPFLNEAIKAESIEQLRDLFDRVFFLQEDDKKYKPLFLNIQINQLTDKTTRMKFYPLTKFDPNDDYIDRYLEIFVNDTQIIADHFPDLFGDFELNDLKPGSIIYIRNRHGTLISSKIVKR
jgi:hypothetical protein